MALTIEHYMSLATMDRAGTSIGGARRAALRAHLVATCGGVCAGCGGTFADMRDALPWDAEWAVEMCHIYPVTRRNGKRLDDGYAAGNVYLGCRACNVEDTKVYGGVRPFHMFSRPDVISSDWTWATL